jgi:hypothetical protein
MDKERVSNPEHSFFILVTGFKCAEGVSVPLKSEEDEGGGVRG